MSASACTRSMHRFYEALVVDLLRVCVCVFAKLSNEITSNLDI